jgi:DNA-binding CsgD family transcriptional regulator
MTHGNALFLRQLVLGEREAGRLVEVGGVWRWSGAAGVSPVLTELVRARMGTLPGTAREVVDVLALGEPLGQSVLAELAGSDALKTAEAAGLVGFEQDGQRLHARLAHPLYGEVRRTSIGQLRARRLRGAIATALAGTGGRRADDTLRRAILAVDSDLAPDPALLTAAGGAAIGLLDLPLAERLARAAVAAGGGDQARRILADALSWLSRGEEAEAEYRVLAESATTDWDRVGAAFPRAANLFYILRRAAEAARVLDSAQAAVTDEAGMLALTGLRSAFQIHLAQPREAIRNATAALAVPGLPTQVMVMTTYGYVCGLGVLGRAGSALPAAERAYAAADASFDGAVPALGLAMMQLFTLRMAGYLEKADETAIERRARGGEIPGTPQAYAATLMGLAALGHGKVRTAARWLRESRAGLGTDTAGYENACLTAIAETAAKLGDVGAAHEALDLLDSQPHPTMVIFQPDIELARAWLAAAEATVTDAIAYAHQAAAIARDGDRHAQEILALQTALQFGDDGVVTRLRELVPLVEGPRGPAALAHAEALSAGSGEALVAASQLWEGVGDLLAAADAAAQAATAYLGRDQRKPAATATDRARRLAAGCEGASTPALVAAIRPLPLTGREREIVSLAAQGLANQQIAARLGVSVRTVEGHLYRAGTKLGTTNRADFAALLR